jgi:hypothetical protein
VLIPGDFVGIRTSETVRLSTHQAVSARVGRVKNNDPSLVEPINLP